MSRLPFSLSETRSSEAFHRIHLDVWGPSPCTSISGYRYYVIFVDDCTRYTWVYPLINKSDVFGIFVKFHAYISTFFNKHIKIFQSDGGGEFVNTAMRDFLAKHGILHYKSCPHTPQQNGLAERKHKHLVDTALTLLSTASMPLKFWFHAVSIANFLISRMCTKVLNWDSPYSKLFGVSPQLQALKVFGCACYPYLRPYQPHKLHFRSSQCVFVGYTLDYKGYLCFRISTSRLYISRHVIFDENVFPFATIKANTVNPLTMPFPSSVTPLYTSPIRAHLPPTITASLHDHGENISDSGGTSGNAEIGINGNGGVSASAGNVIDAASDNPDNGNDDHCVGIGSNGVGIGSNGVDEGNTHEGSNDNWHNVVDNGISIPVELPLIIPHADTSSNSFHATTSNVHPMITKSKVRVSKKKKAFAASKKVFSVISRSKDDTIQEPKTYKQALQSPEWFAAMKEEFDALHRQKTWSLVPLPSHRTVVGCKWVFKVKKNAEGSVARFKARLVAKGYHQEEGIDYTKTFSPVVKHTTVRLILALATQFKWKLKQLDVKNAFLHGVLTEEVYMDQPPGLVDQGSPQMVCRLHKSLYGLKQAPRAWNERFSTHLIHLGFTQSFSDPVLFIYNKGFVLMLLLLYVDDIILTGNNQAAIDKLILTLSAEFDMKDLGELSYFLGLQIQHTSSSLFVNQAKYASELLAKMNMQTCATVPTPMLPGTKLYKNDGELLDNPSLYRSIVGALQYLTFSRPDKAYVVNYACQFLQQPTTTHLIAVKRILRYIQGTLDYGIQFTSGFLELQAYTDADWAGDPNDRKSTSGYVVFLGRNPISWGAKKQTTVSRSSTEAEYRSLANSACELVWLKQLLQEIHITLRKPPVIWCDNISAIALAHNPVFHSKTRHMEIDVHFVRERVQRKEMQVCHLSSTEQLGDILTKSLAAPQFQYLRNNLMLGKPRMSLQGERCCFDISQLHPFIRAADGTDSWSRFFQPQISLSTNSFGWLCNTVEEIEPFGLDILRKNLRRPVWSTGPLIPREALKNTSTLDLSVSRQRAGKTLSFPAEKCLEWLDQHASDSVIYISFGSQNTISETQMKELAIGLEESGRAFIWVIRPPVGFDLKGEFREEWLPQGFEERMSKSKQGLLLHNWAPQLEILSHKSTRVFVSHCGWNSVMESLIQGVPIVGWPLDAEQGYNSKMLVEEMGVSVELARGVQSNIVGKEVKGVIDLVMDEGGKGGEMWKNAVEIKEKIRASIRDDAEEKGSSVKAMDDLVAALLSKKQESSKSSN
ncbi:unnamed protein product [Prunus armeniaca]